MASQQSGALETVDTEHLVGASTSRLGGDWWLAVECDADDENLCDWADGLSIEESVGRPALVFGDAARVSSSRSARSMRRAAAADAVTIERVADLRLAKPHAAGDDCFPPLLAVPRWVVGDSDAQRQAVAWAGRSSTLAALRLDCGSGSWAGRAPPPSPAGFCIGASPRQPAAGRGGAAPRRRALVKLTPILEEERDLGEQLGEQLVVFGAARRERGKHSRSVKLTQRREGAIERRQAEQSSEREKLLWIKRFGEVTIG